jgi:hypothetical protein
MAEKDDIFTVKLAYCQAANFVSDPFFEKFWNKLVPSKISTFAWKVVLDRIPTRVNLLRRGVSSLDGILCPLCGEEDESAHHLFFSCKSSKRLWDSILFWLGIETTLHFNSRSHFDQFYGLAPCHVGSRQRWQCIWFAAVWQIWLCRNSKIFEQKN